VLKLVNDLDLLLTDAAMNQYFPWTLNPANPSAAALRNARNFRDNVEQVLIGNTLAGSIFTISINLSGLLTNGGQPFSLLVSGASFAIPEPGALAALVVAIPLLIGRRKRRNLP